MNFVYNVGVAMATYNGGQYIYEQLDSIVSQSVKPDVIVISDGGSTDDTISVCKEVLSKSNIRFKILTSKTRLSIRENFEKSIMNCNARYVFFSDQDDVWAPIKIERCLRLFQEYQPAMIFSNADLVDETLQPLNRTLWESIHYNSVSEIAIYQPNSQSYYKEMVKNNIVTGMCMAIDCTWADKFLPFSKYAIHDRWIASIIAFYAPILAYKQCLVQYRQHAKNAVGTSTSLMRAYAHKGRYLKRLTDDILLCQELIKKCTDPEIEKLYRELESFLDFRKKYIGHQEKAFSFAKHIKDYNNFSRNWKKMVMKDIYAKYFMTGYR